jgi:outer membrane protein assembly factor BamB
MRASLPFQSGVVVFGQQVVAASADGHVYSFDRLNGNQRWRYQVGEQVTLTPAVANNVVYVITASGRVVAIDENGQLRWQQNYGFQPRHSIIAGADYLYVVGRTGTSDRLFVLNQSNGTQVRDWPVPEGDTLAAPALGGQMIFLSGKRVWALDAFTYETVWQSPEYELVSAPVYVTPGVHAAAELYVADEGGTLLGFNANNAQLLMQSTFGEPMTSLAINSRYVAGVGRDGATVRVFDRFARNQIWAQALSIGQLVGGPIVDEERVLVASNNGALQLIDVLTGSLTPTNVQFEPIAGSLAVSGRYIYASSSSSSGQIFAAYQSP